MKNSSRFSILLDKYLKNTISDEELSEFLDLLESEDTEERFKENLELLWEQNIQEEPLSNEKSQALFDKINRKKAAHLTVHKTVSGNNLWKWSAAAGIIISLLASFIYFSSLQEPPTSTKRITVFSDTGEINHFLLPDSSEVWLNSGSTISYDSEFRERSVIIVGEAFFDVKRDTLRPFLVKSEEIFVKVLGTSFNVRSYQEDASINVTVATGKVGVGKLNQSTNTIIPNQQLTYKKSEGEFSFSEVDASSLSSWKDGYLVFENTTFKEAAITLEKHFGIQFQFQNQTISSCRFTSKFDKNESLDHVLEVLSKVNGISWKQDKNKILFIGSTCL
ncbi:FecR family protein [Algoriphagus vanfongensis]|uniref:FecR family protein n=1 Tax=Algoriphagus vanfongensis TaxID=426371 RepID=UPI00040B0A9A|nr:FecR family protein [Algoriphagus vanfongensis]